VRVDAFAIRLRRRSNLEAADLGARLCQSVARQVYTCYIIVALPAIAIALATFEIATWLPTLLLWWLKPWFDRAILFVLSRAAFGQSTTLGDVWQAQGHVLWSQLLGTLTLRRLSPWRSFTQPAYQLEGLSLGRRSQRVSQLRSGKAGSALLMTSAYSCVEMALMIAFLSLAFWFAPTGQEPQLDLLFTGEGERTLELAIAVAYSIVIIALEPFYVASGFGLYLNRRVELEAWDIEQEFRRAFPQ
jgi:hypothetical protein